MHHTLLNAANAAQYRVVARAMGLKRRPDETGTEHYQKQIRQARLSIYNNHQVRWSTHILRAIWNLHEHIARQSGAAPDNVAQATLQWRNLSWWKAEQANPRGARHAARYNPFLDVERYIVHTAGIHWQVTAQHRPTWTQLQHRFVQAHDVVPWSSGKQASIQNLHQTGSTTKPQMLMIHDLPPPTRFTATVERQLAHQPGPPRVALATTGPTRTSMGATAPANMGQHLGEPPTTPADADTPNNAAADPTHTRQPWEPITTATARHQPTLPSPPATHDPQAHMTWAEWAWRRQPEEESPPHAVRRRPWWSSQTQTQGTPEATTHEQASSSNAPQQATPQPPSQVERQARELGAHPSRLAAAQKAQAEAKKREAKLQGQGEASQAGQQPPPATQQQQKANQTDSQSSTGDDPACQCITNHESDTGREAAAATSHTTITGACNSSGRTASQYVTNRDSDTSNRATAVTSHTTTADACNPSSSTSKRTASIRATVTAKQDGEPSNTGTSHPATTTTTTTTITAAATAARTTTTTTSPRSTEAKHGQPATRQRRSSRAPAGRQAQALRPKKPSSAAAVPSQFYSSIQTAASQLTRATNGNSGQPRQHKPSIPTTAAGATSTGPAATGTSRRSHTQHATQCQRTKPRATVHASHHGDLGPRRGSRIIPH